MKFPRKIIALASAIVAVCLFLSPRNILAASTMQINVGATAYSSSYVIHNFESEITVSPDASLFVKEKIETEFFQEKHGIYRIIPIIYSGNGKTIRARLNNITVTDEKNRALIFETSRFGKSIKIKIGDPNQTITGKKTYLISYRIRDVLLRYPDHDEVYWNVTGSEWDTTVEKSLTIVNSDFANITKADCFLGQVGTQEKYCQASFDKSSAHFYSQVGLNWGRDFTIVVGLDKNNSIKFAGAIEKFLKLIADNWGYLFSFLPLTIIFLVWRKKGRDLKFVSDNVYFEPEDKKTTITSLFRREHLPMVYSPINGLTPAEVGTIIDERVDIQDIVAEIIELARLKFLKIERTEEKKSLGEKIDYVFTKLKKDPTKLRDYQRFILEKIFEEEETIRLSSLKNKFYKNLNELKKTLYKGLSERKVFDGNPETIRATWTAISFVLILFSSAIVMPFAGWSGNLVPVFVLILTIFPIMVIARNMPRRTAWGHSLYRQAVGLRYYINIGKWREEIAEKNLFVEEILPLAICLGVVEKLAKDMKDLGVPPPNYLDGFVAGNFAHDIDHFYSTSSQNLVSSPSHSGSGSWSGGSGFSGSGGSGGGFGGGGGGSW